MAHYFLLWKRNMTYRWIWQYSGHKVYSSKGDLPFFTSFTKHAGSYNIMTSWLTWPSLTLWEVLDWVVILAASQPFQKSAHLTVLLDLTT